MPRIKKLAPEEISKIAAGEVVERPANVVKELIENALDAGATEISVHIANGGKSSIRIIDNGCGMDAEDARACFEHHATSKLTSVLDLHTVHTFGFRGEALSSIAAVSEVTLITKQPTSLEGLKLSLVAGAVKTEELVSCNTGTSITVNSLFFNVPARKKFLRSTETEWHQISQLFQSFALNYPEISWSLYHNDSLTHRCPPVQELKERLVQLWGDSAGSHAMTVIHESHGIQITGVISDHQYHRFDRGRIFFFVNKRWVKNQQLGRALIKGYANVLPQGQYPLACISIMAPATEVDINVHPRKEEVQFAHPRIVEQAIQMTTQSALQERVNRLIGPRPSLPTFSDDVFSEHPAPTMTKERLFTDLPPSYHHILHATPAANQQNYIARSKEFAAPFFNTADSGATTFAEPLLSFEPNNVIGQFNSTYILVEHTQGLLLIDQHAAHERILYERFLQRFDGHAATKLLFPQMVQLSSDDIAALTPYFPLLQEEGIEAEQAGPDQLVITALPMAIKQLSIQDLLGELASWIHEHQQLEPAQIKSKIIHHMRAMMACKAAVKAGDLLSNEQINQLLHDLQTTPNRLTCPHGRPTSWLIGLSDIERKFKRKL